MPPIHAEEAGVSTGYNGFNENAEDNTMKYSLWQRAKVRMFGRACLGYVLKVGWSCPTKNYLAKCQEHGYFEDTLHVHREYMNCPECLKERPI
jgi:hypothetical protein